MYFSFKKKIILKAGLSVNVNFSFKFRKSTIKSSIIFFFFSLRYQQSGILHFILWYMYTNACFPLLSPIWYLKKNIFITEHCNVRFLIHVENAIHVFEKKIECKKLIKPMFRIYPARMGKVFARHKNQFLLVGIVNVELNESLKFSESLDVIFACHMVE